MIKVRGVFSGAYRVPEGELSCPAATEIACYAVGCACFNRETWRAAYVDDL
jgi:hypothetical protein